MAGGLFVGRPRLLWTTLDGLVHAYRRGFTSPAPPPWATGRPDLQSTCNIDQLQSFVVRDVYSVRKLLSFQQRLVWAKMVQRRDSGVSLRRRTPQSDRPTSVLASWLLRWASMTIYAALAGTWRSTVPCSKGAAPGPRRITRARWRLGGDSSPMH
jgi:hypothetical protein